MHRSMVREAHQCSQARRGCPLTMAADVRAVLGIRTGVVFLLLRRATVSVPVPQRDAEGLHTGYQVQYTAGSDTEADLIH